MHNTPLIATIVAGLSLAYAFGILAYRFKLPPLVGYLFAGVLVGPYTPGFIADSGLAQELAEIGVILLMFGVGLHFSLKDLLSVRAIAVPGAFAQIAASTAMGLVVAHFMNWPLSAGMVFGLALSVSSTVVLLRVLQEHRLVDTERGRIMIGWLIVQDIAMVLVLVLLPAFADAFQAPAGDVAASFSGMRVVTTFALTFAKVGAFFALMLLVGRRLIPWILHETAHTGSRELFRLSVLVIALGVAFGSAKLFGVSLALGAFFAGMILSESALSQRAAQESLPLRDAFAVLFFVSVGMLFNPAIILLHPFAFLATLAIILIGKSIIAYVVVRLCKIPKGSAASITASLAQIGEFSFILAELGVRLGLLSEDVRALILSGAIISIAINAPLFSAAEKFRQRYKARFQTPAPANEGDDPAVAQPPTEQSAHSILIGFGRVGSIVGPALDYARLPYLVIEDADEKVRSLRGFGTEVIAGNAVRTEILKRANLSQARRLIVAIPEAFEAGQIVAQARAQNKSLQIIVRAHSDAEVNHLYGLGADVVIMGEREIARTMIEHILKPDDPETVLAETDLIPA